MKISVVNITCTDFQQLCNVRNDKCSSKRNLSLTFHLKTETDVHPAQCIAIHCQAYFTNSATGKSVQDSFVSKFPPLATNLDIICGRHAKEIEHHSQIRKSKGIKRQKEVYLLT